MTPFLSANRIDRRRNETGNPVRSRPFWGKREAIALVLPEPPNGSWRTRSCWAAGCNIVQHVAHHVPPSDSDSLASSESRLDDIFRNDTPEQCTKYISAVPVINYPHYYCETVAPGTLCVQSARLIHMGSLVYLCALSGIVILENLDPPAPVGK